MPLSKLTPETNRMLLEPCVVEPAVGVSILSGMAKVAPPAVLYSVNKGVKPLPVTLRHVSRSGLQLHTAHWHNDFHDDYDGGAGTFVGMQGRYKIQFQISRLSRVRIQPMKDGEPLAGNFFECRFPDPVWRINRREAFRATPGFRTPVWCNINLPNQKLVIAKVIDVGVGGVGLELPVSALDLSVGTIWPDCLLRLGDHRRNILCRLTIASIGGKASRPDYKRIGCVLDLPDPSHSGELQMLIFDVEAGRRSA